MSLTDEELRAEKARPEVGSGYVTVNSEVPGRIEEHGIYIYTGKMSGTLPIEEATALRDGLTVVIDQYHDFIARRDAKTNKEIIDKMEPGTVFRWECNGTVRIFSKTVTGKVFSGYSTEFLHSSNFDERGTITVVDQ